VELDHGDDGTELRSRAERRRRLLRCGVELHNYLVLRLLNLRLRGGVWLRANGAGVDTLAARVATDVYHLAHN
jgi:hypothetical protein